MAREPEPGPAATVGVSLFFLALGIIAFICAGTSGDPDGKVMCGDDEMAPGDSCTTWVNGGAETRSYDEQSEQNDRLVLPVVYVIGGLIAVVIGIAGLADAGSKARDFDTPVETEWQRSLRTRGPAPAPSPPPSPTSALRRQRRSHADAVNLVVMRGEDVVVEVDRQGLTIRTGPRAIKGPGDRVPLRRIDWHEILVLKFDSGSTGMRLALRAIDRYSGKRVLIADTWAFELPELQSMAATIERMSEGEARLR
jgi:hypothetical protein